MPKLNQIVDQLNSRLISGKLKGHSFQLGKFYGLTSSVIKSDGTVIPITLIGNTEIDVTINNRFPFQIYHKSSTASYPKATDNHLHDTLYQVTAVVFYDSSIINIIPQDLAYLIKCEISGSFTKTELGTSNLSRVDISATSALFDTGQLFSIEYPKYDNKLAPEQKMFSVNYSVNISSQCGCISCEECN